MDAVKALPRRSDGKVDPKAAIDCIDLLFAKELASMKPKAKKTPSVPGQTAAQIDDAWLAELEMNPAYVGIDVRRELGKMQAWSVTNKALPTRRRFVNWLNKATPNAVVQVNGAGQSSFSRPVVGIPEPMGWRQWALENMSDPANAQRPWSSFERPAQEYITKEMKKVTA